MREAAISIMHDHDLEEALAALRQGGTILFPTDTNWKVGCDACNTEAIQKIYELKNQDFSQSFILLVDSIEMLKDYVKNLHPKLETLMVYHVRPLTIVYDRPKNLPSNAVASDGSVAIRIPQDEYCRYLIKSFGRPLVVTSARISKEPLPDNFSEISKTVKKKVDYIAKHRQEEHSLNDPSVIVRLSSRGELLFLRE
ncbi:MAG: L-threonylcarbamoyladenylate synthase [Bacteroidota bacterium]